MAYLELALPVQNKRFDGLVREILKGQGEISDNRDEI
jgi:hypothetical protein